MNRCRVVQWFRTGLDWTRLAWTEDKIETKLGNEDRTSPNLLRTEAKPNLDRVFLLLAVYFKVQIMGFCLLLVACSKPKYVNSH